MRHRPRLVFDRKLIIVVLAIALAAAVTLARTVLQPPPSSGLAMRDRETTSRDDVAKANGAAQFPSGAMPRVERRGEPSSVVYVVGAVVRSGVYTLRGTPRIVDALARAGGPSADADLTAINLAHRIDDGEMVFVPRRGAPSDAERVASLDEGPQPDATPAHHRHRKRRSHRKRTSVDTSSDTAPLADPASGSAMNGRSDGSVDAAGGGHRRRHRRHAPPSTSTDGLVVDINTANADSLAELPGIGVDLAARIVEFRDLNGPFASTDELLDVAGITPGKLDAITPFVIVR